MKIYHGTNEHTALKALNEGLKPRIATGKSNWKHTTESNPSMVYLTDTYAPYFAFSATPLDDKGEFTERMAIIEIDTELLDERWMMPDEDAIEQMTRHPDDTKEFGIKGKSVKQRTKWVRDHINEFQHCWEISLSRIGNCAYKGTIPVEAITRVVLHNESNQVMNMQIAQPTITTMNFKFYGNWYKMLTKWFAGYDVTVDELFATRLMGASSLLSEEERAMEHKAWSQAMADRSGMEIIYEQAAQTV
jgi:hypothetical protein